MLPSQLLAPSLAHCSVATNADHRGGAAPAQVARLESWLAAAGGDLAAVEIRESEACFSVASLPSDDDAVITGEATWRLPRADAPGFLSLLLCSTPLQ